MARDGEIIMNNDNKKKIIENLISQNKLAVLSTITPENTSESAVIEISMGNNLELIFDTLPIFRKYKNLGKNQSVSVVIGMEPETIQYEGIAKELDGKELEKYKKIHYRKFPDAVKFEKDGAKFFKVTPKWVRFADVSEHPWKTFETKFPLN